MEGLAEPLHDQRFQLLQRAIAFGAGQRRGQVIDAAIAVSDFVILPTQATGLDTARVWETLPAVKDRIPYGVLITSARLNTNLLENAKAAFDDNDVSRFETVIPMRERIRTTFGWTPTHDDGYADVIKEIEEALA